MAEQNLFQDQIASRIRAIQEARTEQEKLEMTNKFLQMLETNTFNVSLENMPEGVTIENMDVVSAAIQNATSKLSKKTDVKDGFSSLIDKLSELEGQKIGRLDQIPNNMVQMFMMFEFFKFAQDGKGKDETMMRLVLEKSLEALLPGLIQEIANIKVSLPEPNVTVDPEVKVNIPLNDVIKAIKDINIPDGAIDLNGIMDALEPLKFLSNSAKRPLAVRMSDGANFIKFAKEIKKILGDIDEGQRQVVAFAGGPKTVSIDSTASSGRLYTNETYSTIADGRTVVTTAGTAVQLSATSTPCKKVIIMAETDNTEPIVVGNSTVVAATEASNGTRRGQPLFAGQTGDFWIDNLNKLYIDAGANGEGVTYVYYN